MRGLLSLQIFMAIRNHMKQIQPDCAPLQDYFDYLAGTSIGGLIALASSALNASLEESRDDLFNVVDDVFTIKPTFTFEAADGIAKSTFGLEMKISDIKKQCITCSPHAWLKLTYKPALQFFTRYVTLGRINQNGRCGRQPELLQQLPYISHPTMKSTLMVV